MNKWIVITTINKPTEAIIKIASMSKVYDWSIVVVGDLKTPRNWNHPGVHYLSIDRQNELFPKISKKIPNNHYCRKNIGYLYAINNGADCILETDDDNIPYDIFGQNIEKAVTGKIIKNSKWVNVYKYFTDSFIWPRGIPLDSIHGMGNIGESVEIDAPIQQYLADGDPDVDAIYRLLFENEVYFDQKSDPVVLDRGVWCPFNSQNTIFFSEVFPLLYLPCFVSFRMTDIWRSFVAQIGLWHIGKKLTFSTSTVKQVRNEHNLMIDFEDEVPGYLQNENISDILEAVLESSDVNLNLSEVTKLCWEQLIEEGIVPKEELEPIEAWFQELKKIE
ncbi:hypothetical protein [uncultured Gammaproteobacteria bacterium]|nr:hypothetical protein [uncultured Gammaproteobacteria bacterium]